MTERAAKDDARELERLRAWKREATALFDGLQDLGRALDIPLGVLVTGPLAVEAANRLRAERDAARAELAERDIPTEDRP